MGFDFLSRFRKQSADDPPAMESWPLFAFGKLPVYKDFISSGLTDDVSREFRDWLSNGFSRLWSTRDDCRSSEIPLHAFLIRLPESRKMAVGALWGSSDQGGLRKFPFALFTILPAGKPVASVLTALDYLPVFESRAREIRRKYDAGGSLAAVYQELRGAKIEIPVRKEEQVRMRLAGALAHSRVGPLAMALFEKDAATQWTALLSGLDAAARRPTAGAAAFRLPLAEGTAPLDQLKLWTVRLTKASPAGAGPTGVLYRTGGEVPSGVFFFRDARAEDILLFHPAAISTDFVEEIPPVTRGATEPAEAVAEPAAQEAPQPLVPEPSVKIDLPSEAAPSGTAPPMEEILLGAAARTADLQPARLSTGLLNDSAAVAPAVSESPAVPEPSVVAEPAPVSEAIAVPDAAAVPEAAPIPEPAALPEPVTVPEPAAAVSEPSAVPADPAADTSPSAPSPPASLPQAEPVGWDLPLASLLETA